jgi:hypothetical protein
MGLLDDAIREHLDLKRRRGGDPTEIERAERDALGPVRRDPFEHDGDEPEGREAAYDQAVEEEHDDNEERIFHDADGDWGEASDESEAVASEPPAAHEPLAEDLPESHAEELPEPLAEEGRAQVETERVHEEPHTAEPPAGEETVEYDVERELAEEGRHTEPHEPETEQAAPKPEGEDVLEETPEFLQDTPDHDRLWFEQRPPRDFDFDG